MRITGITPIIVSAKLLNWVFVKVETDEGIVGWGEATCEWKSRGVAGCVDDLSTLLIGEDPRRTEYLWQIMYRQYFIRPGIVALSAVSGIDQACWDIHAKSLGVPLYQLLGGAVRDKVRMYDHLGGGDIETVFSTTGPEGFVEKARESVDAGFSALKVVITYNTRPLDSVSKVRTSETLMRALREGLGDDVDIMIDCHGRHSPDMAIQLGTALEPYRPFWFEEPCPPDNIPGLLKVARALRIPVAAGERIVTRQGFRPLFEGGGVAVVQPDVCHTGGITELRKIASMADTYNIAVAPHNPMGPVATAVNVHVAMATPNFLIQELLRMDVPWRNDVVHDPIEVIDGHARATDTPGIGVEVNEDEAAAHPWERDSVMRFFNEDGSVADW